MTERHVDVAIIGSGTAGLSSIGNVRKATTNFVLINGGEVGTTCARVGCMPSKAMIHLAEDFHARHHLNRFGIDGSDGLGLDTVEAMEYVRDMRDTFVDRVTGNSTDNMGDKFIQGYAHFIEPHLLEIDNGERIRADKIIIATGSRPIIPAAWQAEFGDKILTSDNLFEQETLPESIAVIGLGVIGLELGQSLQRMGVNVTGIDQLQTIAGLSDPVANDVAMQTFGREFPLWLGHAATLSTEGDKIKVSAGDKVCLVDKILLSIGRIPNVENLGLENADIERNQRGVPIYNENTMQVGDSHIFMAGDMNHNRMILHEAGHEGRIAGYNAVNHITAFKRHIPLGITFSDPNIATVGASYADLDPKQIVIGEMRLAPVGRALLLAKNKGVLRVYVNKADGKILGATLLSVRAEHLGHLLTWAIHQNLNISDLLSMPFYHPVIEEALQGALYNALGKLELSHDYPIELRPA